MAWTSGSLVSGESSTSFEYSFGIEGADVVVLVGESGVTVAVGLVVMGGEAGVKSLFGWIGGSLRRFCSSCCWCLKCCW